MPHVTRQVTPVECDTRLSIAFKILDDTEYTIKSWTISQNQITNKCIPYSINNCLYPMKNIKCYAHLLEIWVLTCDYFLDRHGSSWGRREWKQMTIWNKQIVLYQLLLPLWQTCKQCWTMCRMESTISNKQILHFRNLGGHFYKCSYSYWLWPPCHPQCFVLSILNISYMSGCEYHLELSGRAG